MIKNLETDLKKLRQLGKKREKENTDFRMFLKGEDASKVDKIIHRLNDEISHEIDCTSCANCCKMLHPALTKSDINRLAGIKNLSVMAFQTKYVEKDPYDQEQFMKHVPCIFLEDKLCRIYNQRPETCQSYPNLHKQHMVSRTLTIMANYHVCPIVFNVVEVLKRELNYKY